MDATVLTKQIIAPLSWANDSLFQHCWISLVSVLNCRYTIMHFYNNWNVYYKNMLQNCKKKKQLKLHLFNFS